MKDHGNEISPKKSIALVLLSISIAFAISVLASSIQKFGSISAIKNPTVAFDLMSGALGAIIIVPSLHIAVASMWSKYRNSRSRRNIFFCWGIAFSAIQIFIIISASDRSRLEEAAVDAPKAAESITSPTRQNSISETNKSLPVAASILDR